MQVITVANQKGGCGKTITSVNLAGAFASMGKRVLFVDIDPQSHGTFALGMDNNNTAQSSYMIYDAFLGQQSFDPRSIIKKKNDNLSCIVSHLSLSTMEQKIGTVKDALLVISRMVKDEVQSDYDYVIIDTPPNLGFLTLNGILAADRLIVPLDVSLFSMNGVAQIRKLLDISHAMGFSKPNLSYVINMYDGRSNFAKKFLKDAKERFGGQLMETTIRLNVKLREAALFGKPIFEYAPNANGAKDYMSLACEIEPSVKEEGIPVAVGSGSYTKIKEDINQAAETMAEEMVQDIAEATINNNTKDAGIGAISDEEDLKKIEDDLSKPVIEGDIFSSSEEEKESGEIDLTLIAPEAKEIYVAGSFNNWQIDKVFLMDRSGDGLWSKKLVLPAGRYQYKFVIDGIWKEDPNNESQEDDMMGGKNSVIEVE